MSSRQRGPSGRTPAVIAAALAMAGTLVLTTVLATAVRRTAHDEALATFERSAAQSAAGVQDAIRRYYTAIEDVGALIANVPGVTPAEIKASVESAGIFKRLPAVAGILYVASVSEADFPAFLAAAKEANPDFEPFVVSPTGEVTWPRYLLVHWVPGALDLRLPVGADFTSIQSVIPLIQMSARTGNGVVGSFQQDPALRKLANDLGLVAVQQFLDLDFFIGVPVYAPAPPGGTRGAPVGWVAAPISHFQDVLEEAAKTTPQGLGVGLTVDLAAPELGDRKDLSRVTQREGTAGPRDASAFQIELPFDIEGVTFHLSMWSTSHADDAPYTVLLVWLVGLVGSLLAAAVVYQRFRTRDREQAFAAELADRALFQRQIVESVTSAMVVLDADGKIVAANPAWAALLTPRGPLFGEPPPSEIGRAYLDVMAEPVRSGGKELADAVEGVLAGRAATVEVDLPLERGVDRGWFAVRVTPLQGVHGGAVVMHTDITERKRSHDELEFSASHDDLTGLLSRSALESEIDDALGRATADGTSVAALYIDLDGFKGINDTHGHAVGDEVLRAVSTRITKAVRRVDRVGRLGGDEFLVLIAPLASPATATTTAQRILRSFDEPVALGAAPLWVNASVGVAVVDDPGAMTGAQLIERADGAMYRAKAGGGSTFELAR